MSATSSILSPIERTRVPLTNEGSRRGLPQISNHWSKERKEHTLLSSICHPNSIGMPGRSELADSSISRPCRGVLNELRAPRPHAGILAGCQNLEVDSKLSSQELGPMTPVHRRSPSFLVVLDGSTPGVKAE